MWLIPRAGRQGEHIVADVVVRVRSRRPYTYAIPAELQAQVRPGAWVEVPFGQAGRLVEGVCVGVSTQPFQHTRKPIARVLPAEAVLDDSLIELGLWLADYYFCPVDVTFAALTPAAARQVRKRRVTRLVLRGQPDSASLTPKQRQLVQVLADGPRVQAAALAEAGVSTGIVTKLVKQGILARQTDTELVPPAELPPPPTKAAPHSPEDRYLLTDGQQGALDQIVAADTWRVFLLFGVPGSGKTEVYVRAIQRLVAAGRQAIMIVPEIALATQVVERLARRFARVAILHSGLTEKRRAETLRRIAADHVDVVIGTRSAVFAPCRRLGLLVVDEEQEGSLKNLAAPYFHARDVAIKRGQLLDVPVVLGSATPALETWYNAQHLPHYTLLELPQRVPGAELPKTELVTFDAKQADQMGAILSGRLSDALRRTIASGQQAILLHNRRGYAVNLRCMSCGTVVGCPRCAAYMVVHHVGGTERRQAELKCHQCNFRQPAPTHCPDSTCNGTLVRSGLAIQKLEEALRRLLPDARLLRLDSDTMKHRDDYRIALEQFEAGGADVLLGTQMVAKGLDFPKVGLVGVIDADAGLWLPDFRAGERVFHLLMQVCGRAGRKAGASQALVQSAVGDAPAVRHALQMDYPAFAEVELKSRGRHFLPPTSRLVRLVLSDRRPGRARQEAARLAEALQALVPEVAPHVRLDPPAACVIQRLRDMLRYEILLRGPRDGAVQRLLTEAESRKVLRPKVERLSVDVDPLDMF